MEYKVIYKEDDIRAALNLLSQSKAVGFDTETTHFNSRHGKLRLIQLSDGVNTFIIDCFKLANIGMLQILRPFLESEFPRKVMHNAKFEHHWVNTVIGCRIRGVFDTYIAAKLLDARKDWKLDETLLTFCGIEVSKDQQKSNWGANELSKDQLDYAASDAYYMVVLRQKLIQYLQDEMMLEVAALEFACTEVVSHIETNGFSVDPEMYAVLCDIIEGRRDERANSLRTFLSDALGAKTAIQGGLFGDDKEVGGINLSSHVQIKEAFKKTGVILTSTDKKVIKTLLPQYPQLKYLTDFREAEKLVTSYGRKVIENLDTVSGRIHASFWQMGAETGRFSCTGPNIQQVPNGEEFRRCFRPMNPDNCLVISDYSQIELRILAHYSRDVNMCKAYREGIDLHSMTAKGAYHLDCEISEVAAKYDKYRKYAKALNFGVVYGIGAQKYADNVGIDFAAAESAIKGFYDTYYGAKKWLSGMEREGVSNRYVRTLSGRKIKFHFNPQDGKEVSLTKRNSRNAPIQGTSADILKTALPNIMNSIVPLGGKIVNIVHDEVIVEAPRINMKEIKYLLQYQMESAGKKYVTEVPIEAEAKFCESWAEK